MSDTSRGVPSPRRAGAPAFLLPPLVRAIASRLPSYPPSLACAIALSLAAPRVVGREALAAFEGKSFRIAVRDAGVAVAFRIRGRRFAAVATGDTVDVTFTACAADFLLLAARRADPDTLFFERRLVIEGDTETGHRLKNVLDAVPLPRWLTGA